MFYIFKSEKILQLKFDVQNNRAFTQLFKRYLVILRRVHTGETNKQLNRLKIKEGILMSVTDHLQRALKLMHAFSKLNILVKENTSL